MPPEGAARDGAGAEGGSLDLHRLAVVEGDLADVEHALGRLDDGTWGTCEVCGAALDVATLERHPAARRCAAHR